MRRAWISLFITVGAFAQTPPTMKQLMLDLIHPASNEIILFVNRGGTKTEQEWSAVRHSALVLAESGSVLASPGGSRDQGDWSNDSKKLADVGAAAYRAAMSKDMAALASLSDSLDAACTTCHRQFRPNVFPREGSK
jgi:hypothetical protein